MGVVVSDTSPLLALTHLGQLDLLATIYGEVVVPPAVATELFHPPSGLNKLDVTQLTFARVDSPRDQQRVVQFLQVLDVGEAEALALALELKPEAVLVDEKLGRRLAIQNGLIATGTMGVLLEAKSRSLIPLVRPLMERLRTEIKFCISPRLQADVLKRAGE